MNAIDIRKFVKCDNHLGLFNKELTVSGYLYPETNNTHHRKFSTTCINWSDITDYLIRLTAHYTDSYASDLLFSLKSIEQDLENGEVAPHGYFFGFHECGVDPNEFVLMRYNHDKSREYYRAIWRVLITISDKRYVNMSLHKVEYKRYMEVDA